MARSRTRRTRDDRTDVVRGLLLVAVGAGVLAGLDNLPSTLGPASWEGFGLADLVAGAFPVVVGVAIGWRSRTPELKRLARRVAVLGGAGLLVGLVVHGLPMVWTGPLQQLAVASAVVAVVANRPIGARIGIGLALIAGSAWLLWASPLAGAGSLRPSLNAAASLDQLVLGVHSLRPSDPWGIATLPVMIVLVLAGNELGRWLRTRPDGPATAAALLVLSAWLVVGGLGGTLLVPVNRTLATPTWATLSLAFTFGLYGIVHAALHMGARRLLAPVARAGRHGLLVIVALSVVGAVVVGDGSAGPWRGLRDGLLEPLAGDAWIWVYVGAGALSALALARALDRRNWRLTA
ncbi:MAG TPA: hypothetical protein VGA36_03550 [Nitriliruptorales bacterium]